MADASESQLPTPSEDTAPKPSWGRCVWFCIVAWISMATLLTALLILLLSMDDISLLRIAVDMFIACLWMADWLIINVIAPAVISIEMGVGATIRWYQHIFT